MPTWFLINVRNSNDLSIRGVHRARCSCFGDMNPSFLYFNFHWTQNCRYLTLSYLWAIFSSASCPYACPDVRYSFSQNSGKKLPIKGLFPLLKSAVFIFCPFSLTWEWIFHNSTHSSFHPIVTKLYCIYGNLMGRVSYLRLSVYVSVSQLTNLSKQILNRSSSFFIFFFTKAFDPSNPGRKPFGLKIKSPRGQGVHVGVVGVFLPNDKR